MYFEGNKYPEGFAFGERTHCKEITQIFETDMKTKRNKQNKKVRKYEPSSFDPTMFVVGEAIFLSQHPNPPWKIEREAHYLTWLCLKQGLMASLPKYQNDAGGLADLHGVVTLGPTHPSL